MTVSSATSDAVAFTALKARIEACRICRDEPLGKSLPHEPRPVLQGSPRARLLIAGQAPGLRVHLTGKPFFDRSGDRLRDWLGLDHAAFYDPGFVATVPMGMCFPGNDAKGGDLPPRRECAPAWREEILAALPRVELILAIGLHAQNYHLGRGPGLDERMRGWRTVFEAERRPRVLPLPHPSWRNTGWLKKNPWFEAELLPVLQAEVARLKAKAARS